MKFIPIKGLHYSTLKNWDLTLSMIKKKKNSFNDQIQGLNCMWKYFMDQAANLLEKNTQ